MIKITIEGETISAVRTQLEVVLLNLNTYRDPNQRNLPFEGDINGIRKEAKTETAKEEDAKKEKVTYDQCLEILQKVNANNFGEAKNLLGKFNATKISGVAIDDYPKFYEAGQNLLAKLEY